ncbi:glycine cleavage system transcriptional activatorGcvA [Striga asiatica]|uniref:Glycine cleavage system transcriptional activatorGcvA n=1 Tax=Striga asiatica TaxID=4170 RepID=A0A5A7PZK2_STRAF|nr:glycine cleavage system transcriptional activatorGcvA [Striga asiatica]
MDYKRVPLARVWKKGVWTQIRADQGTAKEVPVTTPSLVMGDNSIRNNVEGGSHSSEHHTNVSQQLIPAPVVGELDQPSDRNQIIYLQEEAETDLIMVEVHQEVFPFQQKTSTQPAVSNKEVVKTKGWKRAKVQEGGILSAQSKAAASNTQESLKRGRTLTISQPDCHPEHDRGRQLKTVEKEKAKVDVGTVTMAAGRTEDGRRRVIRQP